MSGPSRRDVLKVSGLVAAAGLGAVAIRAQAGASNAEPEAVAKLPTVLVSTDVTVRRPNLHTRTPVAVNAPALPYGTLFTQNGVAIGRFSTSRLDAGLRPLHLQRLEFEDGSLVGAGDSAREGAFVIIGHVGGLTRATSYQVVQQANGNYQFTFDTAIGA